MDPWRAGPPGSPMGRRRTLPAGGRGKAHRNRPPERKADLLGPSWSLPRLTGEVRWGSGQHRLHRAPERRQWRPVLLEPPVMLSARLQLQNHPFALDAGEPRDLETRYEQARARKAAVIAVPTEHRYVSTGRRPEAAAAQMNAILESGRIPAACFD